MVEHQSQFHLSSICRVLQVQRSGYYAWLICPQSHRQQSDTALLVHIKQSFDDSHGIYGSSRVRQDLREVGMHCGQKRAARLMHQAQLCLVRGYNRPRYKSGSSGLGDEVHHDHRAGI